MQIILEPIGFVRNNRKDVRDDNWGGVVSEIVIEIGDQALQGIEDFSHAQVLFYFDRVDQDKVVRGVRRPRGNPAWPEVGILAQRGKDRPNRLGLTTVGIIKRERNVLFVTGLDAVDGTPVLDIKPVMKEFLPGCPFRQPEWATGLMKDYWRKSEAE